MLGRRELPESFIEWNAERGAPFGRIVPSKLRRILPWSIQLRHMGPFAVQPNSNTRILEYPWAFHATPLPPGSTVLEIGGGLSGFQFELDRQGCRVTNVDPGLEARGVGWRCDGKSIAKLNRIFGTSVDLRNTVISKANLEPESFDRVFAISVLEHLPEDDLHEALDRSFRCLKPGGLLVMTVDLFLNVEPFTSIRSNRYGKNVSIRSLVETAPFEMIHGAREELNGYPEFDKERVLRDLEHYFVGEYPALVQCVVLRKPMDGSEQRP